jgi:hypothetical protein
MVPRSGSGATNSHSGPRPAVTDLGFSRPCGAYPWFTIRSSFVHAVEAFGFGSGLGRRLARRTSQGTEFAESGNSQIAVAEFSAGRRNG